MIAKTLLELKAVHLSPDEFFTWSSGIKSPIYCDNRIVISAPKEREIIVQQYLDIIRKDYPSTNCIAGTATAGIPWAAWIADKLELPMVYIRSSNKSHGLQNAIEGELPKNPNVVVIEDLISTGGSSINATNELKLQNANVLAVGAIFSYGLSKATENFRKSDIPYFSLCELDQMLDYAKDQQLLTDEQIGIIKQWKSDQN